MVDCSSIGWGASAVCSSITSTGDGSIGLITIVLAIAWIVSWIITIWLFETKRTIFAFAGFEAGLFALLMTLFTAIDATAISNPATANMLQMFVFPITWLLIGSVLAFILYIFLGTLIRMAYTFGIKIQNWWYDGKY
jgi:hypothetical protein